MEMTNVTELIGRAQRRIIEINGERIRITELEQVLSAIRDGAKLLLFNGLTIPSGSIVLENAFSKLTTDEYLHLIEMRAKEEEYKAINAMKTLLTGWSTPETMGTVFTPLVAAVETTPQAIETLSTVTTVKSKRVLKPDKTTATPEQVREWIAEGKRYKELKELMQVRNDPTVYDFLDKYGIDTPTRKAKSYTHHKRTEEIVKLVEAKASDPDAARIEVTIEAVREMCDGKHTVATIAEHFGVSRNAMYMFMKLNELSARTAKIEKPEPIKKVNEVSP